MMGGTTASRVTRWLAMVCRNSAGSKRGKVTSVLPRARLASVTSAKP